MCEENPDIFRKSVYTIKDYLQDISPLLEEGDLRVILAKRHLPSDAPLEELPQRDIDLAEADAYFKLCDEPVGGATVKDVDGSWSHTEGGRTVSKANIDLWYKKYVALRDKWGEEVLTRRKIRIINL